MHTQRALAVTAITRALETYADRGIFRSFSAKYVPDGKYEFRFSWLTDRPFLLIYNRRSNSLLFKNLLPAVESKSFVDLKFRAFLKSRYADERPVHRRVDKTKLKMSCINSDHTLSVRIKILPACDYSYAVNKAVNLVSDVFHQFLHQPGIDAYVRENFSIAGE